MLSLRTVSLRSRAVKQHSVPDQYAPRDLVRSTMRFPRTLLSFLATLFLLASLSPQSHAQASQDGPDLAPQIARIAADIDDYDRFYPLRWSEQLLDRQHRFLNDRLDDLKAINFDALGQAGKVDYLLFRNDIRAAISANRLAARQMTEMDPVLTVRAVVVPLEESRSKMEKLDPQAVAAEFAKVPAIIKEARERVELGRKATKLDKDHHAIRLTPVVAQRAAKALDEYTRTLARCYEQSDGYIPAFSWWCEKPYEEAKKSIEELARFLREEIAGIHGKPEDPLLGDPIGREALLEALRDESIALSPEELIALGETEFTWCEAQMKAAANEMGLGDDWKAALAKVKADTAGPGEQADYVTAVAREAEAFLKEHDLVTVPPLCAQTWRISMLSPQAQRTLPFAVYSGQAIGVAYANASMSHEDKLMSMRGNNRRFTRIVVPHELIPGHHLQSFMAERERPYRRRFSTPFYVEGWALYWEMKLWDMGWAQSPQDRVGMLFWRMHRCARIVVSLKFHLGQMKPQEMIDFLVDRVGHERMGATSEVRRFIGGDYSPLYQCGYMVGGKQLRTLWQQQVKQGGMSEKAFNDAVLHAGPIPIELLRAQMTNQPLTRETEATWRFDAAPSTQ